MSQYTVTINSNVYEVYGGFSGSPVDPTTQGAVIYLGAAIGSGADAWNVLTSPAQQQMLVAATRYIDRQAWQGTPVGVVGGVTATGLLWPRANVIDGNGNAVDPTQVPIGIIKSAFELCLLFADDADVQAAVDAGSNVKTAKAGSAMVENFAPTSARLGTASVLPQVVNQYVGQYLASAALVMPQLAFGTCDRSEFEHHRDEFLRSWPF